MGGELDAESQGTFGRLFDAATSVSATDRTTALGMKCIAETVEQAEIFVRSCIAYFPQFKIVLTRRNDVVSQYGSLERAIRTRRWHSWTKGADLEKKMSLCVANFGEFFLKNQEILRVCEALRETHEVLEIDYERDLADMDRLGHVLFEFLGLAPMSPTWKLPAKVSPPAEEYIENYRALKDIESQIRESGELPARSLLDKAIRSIPKRAHSVEPESTPSSWTAVLLAWKLHEQGQDERALKVASEAKEGDPLFYNAKCLCAEILTRFGDFQKAEHELEQAFAQRQDHPEAYLRRAWLRYSQGQICEAIVDAERAQEIVLESASRLEPWLAEAVREVLSEICGAKPAT
jgi:tetratricopeptide (TPR) repeat protein